MSLGPGSRLDAYELLQTLGAGGMGEVWLATEVRLGRKVALKFLPAELTRDPSRVKRFEQEARAASALNHPNVCTILGLGETSDGQHYIAMEYVEGKTLRWRITGGRLNIRESLDIAIQIAAALAAAHGAGVVHRDIKPENVMIRPDGLVKVLDFGLAKLTLPSASAPVESTQSVFLTETGTVVGTLTYMSPEQARGQSIDARTDIWSLGVVLYEMLAGCPPFRGASRSDVLVAILDRDPTPLARFDPEAPAELQRIVTKSLRKEPALRYQGVQDLLLDLEAVRDDARAQARSGSDAALVSATATSGPVASKDIAARATRRRRVLLTAIATVVLAGVAVGVWSWRLQRADGRDSTEAPVQRNLARLTFGSGLQTDPTFSPDGRFIAYSSDRSRNLDIWVQPVSGGDGVRITNNPAHDLQPAWSPDGSSIVFRSERDGGGLFIVPALGGAERRLTRFGAYPRWSSDGSEIVFCVDDGTGSPEAVYTVPSTGGEPRPLIREFTRQGVWYWAAPHPNGAISVVGVHRERGLGFFTVSRDGRTVRLSKWQERLPLPVERFEWERFEWSASGTVLYAAAAIDGVQNLWKVQVNPETLDFESAERLTTGAGPDSAPVLSRDRRQLAFTVRSESTQIVEYPFDAAAGRVLGKGRPLTDPQADAGNLVLSHDGTRLAYLASEVGSRTRELRIRDMADGTTETVALERGLAWPGAWSRDGRALAFEVYQFDRDGPRFAAVVRSRGGGEISIMPWTQGSFFQPSDWTPDGTGVLGVYQRPAYTGPGWLVVWPASGPPATQAQTVLVEDPKLRVWQARYSPDGRWIAFVTQFIDEPGRLDLVAMRAAGTPRADWVRLASSLETADKPRWAPDGTTVYFIARHASYSGYNVWGVHFDSVRGIPGREPFRVTSFDSPTYMLDPRSAVAEFAVTRERLLLPMMTRASSIWMLDNVDK